MQPTQHYGLGAVTWHSGEPVALTRHHKRRREGAELLEAFLAQHPTETVTIAWDNAGTYEDDEVEAVLRGAAGRLIRPHLPTSSPRLNPIERLWRQVRREVTPCKPFASIDALVEVARAYFSHYNRKPSGATSIIGAHAK